MAQIRFGAGAARGAKTIRKRLGHIAVSAGVLTVGICVWLVTTEAPAYQFVVRLSVDQTFLRQTLSEWGIWAPVIFILLQALQVIVEGPLAENRRTRLRKIAAELDVFPGS